MTMTLTGYVICWGSAEGRDIYGTFFDANRSAGIIVGRNLPVALADNPDDRIGIARAMRRDEAGIAMTILVYVKEAVQSLLDSGDVYAVTASAQFAASFYDDGAIHDWPVTHILLTNMPADPKHPALTVEPNE